MNTIENNKLIAKFIGSDFINNNIMINRLPKYFLNNSDSYNCFHNSWDWLMPVVEKIEDLDNCQVDICFDWCRIGYKGYLFNIDTRNFLKGKTKIEAVYFACIQFIKWYNENKQK